MVAIKTSGNVFSKESIDRLNIKPGHWHDLVTDDKFTRADVITLQVRLPPLSLSANVTYHMQFMHHVHLAPAPIYGWSLKRLATVISASQAHYAFFYHSRILIMSRTKIFHDLIT